MRYLTIIIMTLLLAAPAWADHLCNISGPHNCNEQIEDNLLNLTRQTAAHVSNSQDHHPFKTENDYILAAAASQEKLLRCDYGSMLVMRTR